MTKFLKLLIVSFSIFTLKIKGAIIQGQEEYAPSEVCEVIDKRDQTVLSALHVTAKNLLFLPAPNMTAFKPLGESETNLLVARQMIESFGYIGTTKGIPLAPESGFKLTCITAKLPPMVKMETDDLLDHALRLNVSGTYGRSATIDTLGARYLEHVCVQSGGKANIKLVCEPKLLRKWTSDPNDFTGVLKITLPTGAILTRGRTIGFPGNHGQFAPKYTESATSYTLKRDLKDTQTLLRDARQKTKGLEKKLEQTTFWEAVRRLSTAGGLKQSRPLPPP
ncbi:MAG: hypothetical protein LBL99_02775 [Holosporaceae bacterium]|jgi:hypothetical protein|nr:hypothetical protein [Holosporaceae bacterium]